MSELESKKEFPSSAEQMTMVLSCSKSKETTWATNQLQRLLREYFADLSLFSVSFHRDYVLAHLFSPI